MRKKIKLKEMAIGRGRGTHLFKIKTEGQVERLKSGEKLFLTCECGQERDWVSHPR